jgi:hypothetical protein
MVGRAQSETKKQQVKTTAKLRLQTRATEAYCEELVKKAAGEKSKGALAIYIEFINNHKKEMGETIHINHATIINHAKGKPTCAQANQQKPGCWKGLSTSNSHTKSRVEAGAQRLGSREGQMAIR